MAGVYGSLNSRADFRRALDEAIAFVKSDRAAPSGFPGRTVVEAQLDAMKGWTDGGRDPRPAERGRITLGVVAMREFSDTRDDEIEAWRIKLSELSNFFVTWPDDALAANPGQNELMRLLDVDEANKATARAEYDAEKSRADA